MKKFTSRRRRLVRRKRVPRSRRSYRSKRMGRSRNVSYGQLLVSKLRRPLLGNKFATTLNYVDYNLTIDPSLGGLAASYVYSANGLFDPNVSAVGHQPLGFDQLMQMYNHYTVIGAKLTVRGVNGDTSNNQFFGVYLSSTSTPETDPAKIIENGKGTYTMLAPASSSLGSGSVATLTQKCSISKFAGRPKLLSEDDFHGSSSSNPNEQVYFIIWGAPDQSVDAGQIRLTVRLEYIAVFTEPKDLPLS